MSGLYHTAVWIDSPGKSQAGLASPSVMTKASETCQKEGLTKRIV